VFVGSLTGCFLAAPLAAQQAAKVTRIGYLGLNRAASPHLHEAFRQGLRDLGYVEGRNIVIEIREPKGSPRGSPISRLSWLRSRLMSS
jgi:putative ABC transport system substrate-binding protein